jgi:hypothetical protein
MYFKGASGDSGSSGDVGGQGDQVNSIVWKEIFI